MSNELVCGFEKCRAAEVSEAWKQKLVILLVLSYNVSENTKLWSALTPLMQTSKNAQTLDIIRTLSFVIQGKRIRNFVQPREMSISTYLFVLMHKCCCRLLTVVL